jgi:hypothetical protein
MAESLEAEQRPTPADSQALSDCCRGRPLLNYDRIFYYLLRTLRAEKPVFAFNLVAHLPAIFAG